jgi:uncharacterized OB-fold protein
MTRFVESTITFPYKRSLGPVIGSFMTALTEKRILGIRNGDQVIAPPMEWDPATGAELAHDFVEVGPAGTVQSWTWVPQPSVQHPLATPFAFAFITLDGATTPFLHAVDAGSASAMSEGMRVAPRWRGKRLGRIDDIVCFVPGEQPEVEGTDEGPLEQPAVLMDYLASITYKNPVSPTLDRTTEASERGILLGQKCPECGRVYAGGRGHCPIDATIFTEADDIELSQKGTITNFVVVTPVQYPGQTETERFARVFVLLDGFDVVLGYQGTVEFPVDDVRVGARVSAVWASPGEEVENGAMGGSFGRLVGWMPNGEPDDNRDPDLVNRIF